MKPIHFTHSEVCGDIIETVVMDDGSVWIRDFYVPSAAPARWNPWKRVTMPTDADLLTAEEE